MVSSFNLNLPMDIPWKRICVTEDMLDGNPCDDNLPPKWQSSLALFRYDPPDEFQQHEGYKISYLKLVVTLSGYQPHDKEIQGVIDWDGLDVSDVEDVEQLLGEYLPCTGAILQVSINSPEGRADLSASPFFLDFEPKKRSLYEMATDTNERASRSLETLNIAKSGGTTESTEVLDVDMGGSTSVGVEGGVPGVAGGGLNASGSRQGQWGTKSMGVENEGLIRTTDNSREKRETRSFTTQISQLYNLFDSYHLGTNRAVFFVQPRPHVLEQPSGIVSGPRPVEGVQEIFMVVARPEDQEDFCTAVRLDTAHLTQIEQFEYERTTDTVSCQVSAPAPTRSKDLLGPDAAAAKAEPDVHVPLYAFGQKAGERIYKCNSITKDKTVTYQSPFSDFRIDVDNKGGYEILDHRTSHGSYDVSLSSDGETLTVKCHAKSNYCYNYGGDICLNCPEHKNDWDASASVDVQVNLITREPTKHSGWQQVLLITTRGLCCCPDGPAPPRGGIVTIVPVGTIVVQRGIDFGINLDDLRWQIPDMTPGVKGPDPRRRLQVSNAMGAMIGAEMRARLARPNAYKNVMPYLLTDHFISRLQAQRHRRGVKGSRGLKPFRDLNGLGKNKELAEYFRKPADKLTDRDVLSRSNVNLAKGLGVTVVEAAVLRLGALGIKLRDKSDAPERKTAL